MKKIAALILLAALSTHAGAKVKPVAHYNFGKAGNVSFAVAPETVTPQKGTGTLTFVGRPLFYADAPADKAAKGEGCILFGGKEDGYRGNQALGDAKSNMILEVWVKAREAEGHKGVVVANGSGRAGYTIAQADKQWVLVSGGAMVAVIGEVAKGKWTHLAAVLEDGKGSVWMDGKRTKTFNPTKELAPNFSIAASDELKDFFHGEVYEVR